MVKDEQTMETAKLEMNPDVVSHGGDRFSLQVVINNPHGLHLRPASDVTSLALQTDCSIQLSHSGRFADGRSILELLGLSAGHRASVGVQTQGDAALPTILRLREILSQ
jgi:phosphotransferase system HPr (HPr) family protein